MRAIPSAHGGLIAPALHEMLADDPSTRPSPDELLDKWLGAFETVARLARDLNGTVF